MAVISVNLALLNFLPVPILDGGLLVFFTHRALQAPAAVGARAADRVVRRAGHRRDADAVRLAQRRRSVSAAALMHPRCQASINHPATGTSWRSRRRRRRRGSRCSIARRAARGARGDRRAPLVEPAAPVRRGAARGGRRPGGARRHRVRRRSRQLHRAARRAGRRQGAGAADGAAVPAGVVAGGAGAGHLNAADTVRPGTAARSPCRASTPARARSTLGCSAPTARAWWRRSARSGCWRPSELLPALPADAALRDRRQRRGSLRRGDRRRASRRRHRARGGSTSRARPRSRWGGWRCCGSRAGRPTAWRARCRPTAGRRTSPSRSRRG